MLCYMVFDVCFRLDLLLLIGCLLINYYCKNLLYKLVFYQLLKIDYMNQFFISYILQCSSMFFKFLINIYYLVYFNNIFDDNKSKIIIFEVNFF